MMSFTEYFIANIGTSITYTILALIIAIIFVVTMEQIFDIRLKNPVGKYYFGTKNPIGKVPIMRNPMRKVR